MSNYLLTLDGDLRKRSHQGYEVLEKCPRSLKWKVRTLYRNKQKGRKNSK